MTGPRTEQVQYRLPDHYLPTGSLLTETCRPQICRPLEHHATRWLWNLMGIDRTRAVDYCLIDALRIIR